MSDQTTNLHLPFLQAGQAQKHVTVNESLLRLDALVQCVAASRTTLTQPTILSDGQIYILPSGKSGADWASMADGAIAYYRDGSWEEITPRPGWSAFVLDETQCVVRTATAWIAAVSASATRNRLLNAAFAVNQRALTSVADDAYCFDRWYALTESGQVDVGALAHPEPGRISGMRLTQPDASPKRIGFAQIIESANIADLRARTAAMAVRVRCSTAQAVRMAILEWTGGADAVTSDVVNDWASASYGPSGFFIASVNVIATGAATPAAATWTDLPTISGAFGASLNNAIVMIWTESALAQSATLDIDQAQLEPDICAPFTHRPVVEELARCQRYFYRWGHENGDPGTGFRMFGYGKAGVYEGQTIRHPVRMRAIPTLAKVGTWTVNNCGQPAASDPSTQSCTVFVQVTADGSFDFYPSGASDYLEADAEL